MSDSQTPARVCANCVMSLEIAGAGTICRRFPPVAAALLKPGTCEAVPLTVWPTVKPSDWCGEHRRG